MLNKPISGQYFIHIETVQLICRANQLTGFYMVATWSFNELSYFDSLT